MMFTPVRTTVRSADDQGILMGRSQIFNGPYERNEHMSQEDILAEELGLQSAPSRSKPTPPPDGSDTDMVRTYALENKMHKLRKKLPIDVIEELEAMGEEALRERISQCETNILESEKAQACDGELAALKEKLKEVQGPYQDAKKNQRAIAEYAACVLDKMGVT